MPIPRDHLTFYGVLQRMVRSGPYPEAVIRAVERAAEAAREAAPGQVTLRKLGARVDLSTLAPDLRLDAALSAALEARDPSAVVEVVFGRPLDAKVIRAIRQGRLTEVLERITEEHRYAAALAGVESPLRSVALRAAAVALEELPRPAGLISRGAVEIRATASAARKAGDLVTAVTLESQLAVRELAVQVLREGRDIHQAARAIRRVIGLNRQQARALDKFSMEARAELLKPAAERAYKTEAGVAQAIDRERRRLERHRSETIARTELWQAGQDGQREVWKEAADSGAMEIEGLDANFVSKDGEESEGPLLHVFCFCSQRLRSVTFNGRRVYVREWVVSVRNPCPRCLAFKGARALPH